MESDGLVINAMPHIYCSEKNSISNFEMSPLCSQESDIYPAQRKSSTSEISEDNKSKSSKSSISSSSSLTEKSTSLSSFSLSTLPLKSLPKSACLETTHSKVIQHVCCMTRDISARVFLDIISTISSRRPAQQSFAMFATVLCFIILSLNVYQTEARSIGLCRGIPCANGGRLLVSNSIWGNCRCLCPSGYVGPYCQYAVPRKRNSDTSSNMESQRLSRSERMERIRQRLLQLSNRIYSTPSYDNINDDDLMDVSDDAELRNARSTLAAASEDHQGSINAYRSDRPRRSWYPKDNRR